MATILSTRPKSDYRASQRLRMERPLRSSVRHFPLKCGKSVTVNIGASSRIEGQSREAWR